MKKIVSFLFLICSSVILRAQTFSGTTGGVPDFPGGAACFNATVSGLSTNLYSNYGLTAVTVNITHTYDADLEVVLISPTGVQTILSSNNGGAGDNYTNSVFTMSAGTSITAGTAPFTGNFIPEESFYAQNVGQDGNGVWQLCVTDEVGGDIGAVTSWSLTFAGGATGSPDPGPNPVATDLCSGAPLICNLNGYTGSTYSTYTWSGASPYTAEPRGTAQAPNAGSFCGTNVNNSSWIRFQASSTAVSLGINITNCTGSISPLGERGIQLALYNSCGFPWPYSPSLLPVSNFGNPAPNDENIPSCYGDGLYGMHTLDFNNLVVGNIYYIMFDGWNGNQCDYTITVNNGVQVVNITPSANPICEGDTINLVASAPGTLTTYSWSSVPAGTYPTGSTISVNPTSSTVYSVTASGICGSQTASLPVTVIPSGNPAWNTPPPICRNGTPINLNAYITGTTGGSWTGTGVVGSTFNPASLAAGAYNVTYTTGTSPCQKTETHAITVLQTPDPVITAAIPFPFCEYHYINMMVMPVFGESYVWSTGGTGNNISVQTGGTYWVHAFGLNGCVGGDTISFFANPTPQSNPVIAPANPVICNGQSVTLSTTVPFNSYQWSTGATTPSIGVNIPGTYTVVALDANGCFDTTNTNVIASNITVNISGDSILCPGEITTLTASGGSSYTWSTTATTNSISVSAPGNYSVISTNVNGCSDSDTVTVGTSSLNVSIAGDTVLCAGETSLLSASGGSSYVWSTSATTNTINVNLPGTYFVSGTNANGCSDADTINVSTSTINVSVTGDNVLCPGEITTLTATGGSVYVWSTTALGSSINVNVPGIYSASSTNIDGCTDSDTITVTNSVFVPALNGDTIVCPGDNVILTASGGNSYLWSNSTTNANLITPIITTSNYSVSITNSDGCVDTLSTTVYLYTDLQIGPTLQPDADTTNFGISVTIPVTNNDSITGGITILNQPPNGNAIVTGGDITYTPNSTFSGFDTLTYVSCDPFCITLCDTTTVIIKVNSNVLNFPEFISPNGDGSNDTWTLGDLTGFPDNELTIMNRWGDALYHAKPYNNEWNGQSNVGIPSMSQGVTDGTYFFIFIPYPGDEPVKGFIEIRK